MSVADTIRRAGRNLKQSKTRTILTSLAIAVGAFTIMASLAAGQGAREYADTLISSNVDPDALLIVKDKSIVGAAEPQAALREYDPDISRQGGVTIKQLNQSDIDMLKNRDDLVDIRPIYQIQITYLTFEGNDKKYSAGTEVYSPDILNEVTAGSLPKLGVDLESDEVVVPSSFAKSLKMSEQELLGRKVTLVVQRAATLPDEDELQRILTTEGPAGLEKLSRTETKKVTLTIRALTKPSQTSFTSSSAMQIPITQAEKLANFINKDTDNYHKYFAASAKVKNASPEQVQQRLEKLGFYPQTAKDLQGFLFTIINILLGIVTGFGVIALLASVFGIINTQYISVLERTSQIGLMKALGMHGRHVSRLFRYEAAWIGFLGGVIGIGSAWAIGTALNPWITEVLDLSEGTNLLVFVPLHAVALMIMLIVIAILAGYFPSRKAAKLDPIEALRTE